MNRPNRRRFNTQSALHNKQILRSRGRQDIPWRRLNEAMKKEIPRKRLLDILDQSSLTQLLIQACDGDFSVVVLFQGLGRPEFVERQCLGLGDRQYALLREVRLCCGGQTWVMARSVIPLKSLRGKVRNLKFLGTRPLGATLFKDPGLRRERFDLARVNMKQFLSHSGGDDLQAWARRSVFYTNNHPILVAEAFLEACPNLRLD